MKHERPSGTEQPCKPKFERPPKQPKTEEDLAAIAVLDRLRTGDGDPAPVGMPLACIVKVTECEDVPKAHDAYSMVRVVGPDGRTWRLCVYRKSVKVGKNALFISSDAALPMDDRFRNPAVCSVKEKVYRFGSGLNVRSLLPHVKRNIYLHNCGVLYPVSDFAELKGKRAGTIVAALLKIDSQAEMKELLMMPRKQFFQPMMAPRPGIVTVLRKIVIPRRQA